MKQRTLSALAAFACGISFLVSLSSMSLHAAGSVSGFVWDDLNTNGIQDAGEPGIPNQVVTLAGPVNATTTTDANGAYLFSNLPAGNYTITVELLDGTPLPSMTVGPVDVPAGADLIFNAKLEAGTPAIRVVSR